MKFNQIFNVLATTFLLSPMAMAQTMDCSTLTTRTEVFNGKKFTKYNVVDSAYMKCPQVQATRPVMNWKVKKAEWSAQDDVGFGN